MTGIINSVILNAPDERAATTKSPEFVKTRAMLTEMFESDFDLLSSFATRLLLASVESGIRRDRRRELTKRLLHNGKFSAELRLRFSRWETKFGPDDPIFSSIVAFYAGMDQSKVSQGRKGAKKRADKYDKVKTYAVTLFEAGTWKSTKQARESLWPKVQAKSMELSCPLTESTGPETLYKWLLKSKKKQC